MGNFQWPGGHLPCYAVTLLGKGIWSSCALWIASATSRAHRDVVLRVCPGFHSALEHTVTVNVKGVYNELISITRPRVTSDVLRLLLLLTKCLTLLGITSPWGGRGRKQRAKLSRVWNMTKCCLEPWALRQLIMRQNYWEGRYDDIIMTAIRSTTHTSQTWQVL